MIAAFIKLCPCLSRVSISLLFAFLMGCELTDPGEGTHRFLLPWHLPQGGYSLQEVDVYTLKSPLRMEGQAAQVYLESALGVGGFQGSVARPQLARVGNLWVPEDSLSALAVAAYAQVEQLMFFDQKLSATSHLPWPRKVGVSTAIEGFGSDSALYHGVYDIIIVLPYISSGLPIAANAGILAHEHSHAHFHHLVKKPLLEKGILTMMSVSILEKGEVKNNTDLDIEEKPTELTPEIHNAFVLRGWDEGLADFFGYAYTGDPRFMAISFSQDIMQSRLLDAPIQMLDDSLKMAQAITRPNENRCGGYLCLSYHLGTQLARFLYRVRNHHGLGPKALNSEKALLAYIVERLPELSRRLESLWQTEFLSPSFLLEVLFADQVSLSPEFCADLQLLVAKADIDVFKQACGGGQFLISSESAVEEESL